MFAACSLPFSSARLYTSAMRKTGFALLMLVLCLPLALSGDDAAREPIQLNDDNLEWAAGPGSIPPGAKFVLLEGDPKTEKIFTMRVFLPPGYVIPFHYHDGDERVTVLEGSVEIGIGDAEDSAYITRFLQDGYYMTPPPLRHFVRSGPEGCVLQLTGLGPWTIHYIDPDDDPREESPKAEGDTGKAKVETRK
jgi:hypothetical protein